VADVPPKVRDKIEKLLRLSSSPNPHEAQRALEEAERLMRKHGLTYADFEKDVIVEVDVPPAQVDVKLARVVGISRRCSAMQKRGGGLAFCGKQEAPSRARALYVHLVAEVSAHCEIGPSDPGRFVWRRYYWGGFIHAVTGRLRDAEVAAWREPPPEFEQGSGVKLGQIGGGGEPEHDQAADDLREFAVRLGDRHSLDLFCKQAYEGGIRFGNTVAIPDDDRVEKRTNRILNAKENAS
jgi:hypothetical protein